MLVQSDLNKIEDIKKNIHTSIKNKGVDISNDTPFEEYAEKVTSIKGGATPDDIKLVKFNIDPYQITDQVTMHVTGAISVYKNVAIVEKGATITYYASCDQYEDTIEQTVTVNTDMAVLISMHKTGVIYGFSIDQTISDPSISVSYIKGCDNEYYTPSFMNFAKNEYDWGDWKDAFFIGKPCMLKSNGEVDYYLNPNDYTKKMDGTDSDVSNMDYDGNAMVEFPPIYIKREQVGKTINVYISNVKADEDYEAWNCKREDGTYNEHWYFAAYSGSSRNSILRSMSNQNPPGGTTPTAELNFARANGSGWDITWWADEDTLRMLFFLMHKNLNSRTVLGYPNDSDTTISGNTNDLGLCYGTDNRSNIGAKFLGIENYYGLRWRRCNGLLSRIKDKKYFVKMTKGQQDGTTTPDFNTAGTGYLQLNVYAPSSKGYIKEQTATPYGLLPSSTTSNSTTYYCSSWSKTDNNDGLQICSVGGHNINDGVSSMHFLLPATYSNYSPSLSYHAP